MVKVGGSTSFKFREDTIHQTEREGRISANETRFTVEFFPRAIIPSKFDRAQLQAFMREAIEWLAEPQTDSAKESQLR